MPSLRLFSGRKLDGATCESESSSERASEKESEKERRETEREKEMRWQESLRGAGSEPESGSGGLRGSRGARIRCCGTRSPRPRTTCSLQVGAP
eukprot:1731275-Rhodomonas_salina.3